MPGPPAETEQINGIGETPVSQATSDNRVSVWILGDQLLAQHPALLAAEQGHAPENVRGGFALLELLLH
jgi:hypothetical protein